MRRITFAFLSVLAIAAPPRANSWTAIAPLPEPKALLAGAVGSDKRTYAIGGTSDDGPPVNPQVYAYDLNQHRWTTAAPMNTPRTGFGAAAGPDGRVSVFGGYTGTAYVGTAEACDLSTDTWTVISGMNQVRFSLAAANGTAVSFMRSAATALEGIHRARKPTTLALIRGRLSLP